MMLSIIAEQPPLSGDPEEVIRVGGTRVTLDTVVEAFEEGLSAEEIVQQYSSLRLADVYGAISYYLNHKDEVQQYLVARQAKGDEIRLRNEARFDIADLRARLLARREEQK